MEGNTSDLLSMDFWRSDLIAYTDSHKFEVIFGSFLICSFIFLYNFVTSKEKRIAAEIASLAHHVFVVILSVVAIIKNYKDIADNSAISITNEFSLCNTIQYVNIGYFLYDSLNAITWEHNFIIHHAIALSGFLLSDYYGRGGLGNAVNTFIAEIGSIMYNIYNKNKSTSNYVRFVVIYTITRIIFLYWTFLVYRQLLDGLKEEPHVKVFIYSVVAFQSLLVIVNIHFLSVHLRKLNKIMGGKGSD